MEVNVTFHLVETSISMKFQKYENVTVTNRLLMKNFGIFKNRSNKHGPVSRA